MIPGLMGSGRRRTALLGALAMGMLTVGVSAGPAQATEDATPTNLRMSPTPQNGSDQSCGWIGNVMSTVNLFATVGRDDGTIMGARFKVREAGRGGAEVWDSGWVSQEAYTHEAQASVPEATLLDGHTYVWSVKPGTKHNPLPSRATGCTFTVDRVAPVSPTVTSTDFPETGGGKYAGQPGVFTMDTAGQDDVVAVEYEYNRQIPVGGGKQAILDPVTGLWSTPEIVVTAWAANHLYARSVDRAGNVSQSTIYTFFAPSDPNPPAPVPGDINGDGLVDILRADADGSLRAFSSTTDPTSQGLLASSASQGPTHTDDDGNTTSTWAGARISHRNAEGRDDLFLIYGTAAMTYRNEAGVGGDLTDGFYSGQFSTVTYRPRRCVELQADETLCSSYVRDWSPVEQFVAAGDVDGATHTDAFTIEVDDSGNRRLWLLRGTFSGFSEAIPLGAEDRTGQDIMSPGDVTGDGLPELWVRDRADGTVHQYASARNADGTADLAAYTRTADRTLIGTGFDPVAYPQVSTEGDVDGDGHADLWASTPDGELYGFAGTGAGSFGPAWLIAGS